MNLLLPETRNILSTIPALINKTFPMPARFRGALPSQIAELSRLLTNNRGERLTSYLGRPNFLSAYLRYFLPWNLYRLCILLHSLDISLSPGDIITDLGSGPLTFASALWITRPGLRNIPLEINCVDRCAPALEAGKKFFAALCAGGGNWKIHLVREDINLHSFNKKSAGNYRCQNKKSALVCAVNTFNETYENLSHNDSEGLKRMAANIALFMHRQASSHGAILTVEPGVPQSGRFISLLRNALMELGRTPAAPCTHTEACPFPGGPAAFSGARRGRVRPPDKRSGTKKKWCHFAFDTIDAPKELHRLSAAAKLPKDRLVLSYLLTGAARERAASIKQASHALRAARIISDAFPLPQNPNRGSVPHKHFGRYGCCAQGMVLLAGEKHRIEKTVSGSLVTSFINTNERDEKSGALIVRLPPDKEVK